MSSLDTYTTAELVAELKARDARLAQGRCAYCNRLLADPKHACRFKGKDYHQPFEMPPGPRHHFKVRDKVAFYDAGGLTYGTVHEIQQGNRAVVHDLRGGTTYTDLAFLLPRPELIEGDRVVMPIHNRPELRHGTVVRVRRHASGGGVVGYRVLRGDGNEADYPAEDVDPDVGQFEDRGEPAPPAAPPPERSGAPYHDDFKYARLHAVYGRIEQAAIAFDAQIPGLANVAHRQTLLMDLCRHVVYHALREFRPDLFADRPPGKYGHLTALIDTIDVNEPFFLAKGKDRLCAPIVRVYLAMAQALGQDTEGLEELAEYAESYYGSAARAEERAVDALRR